MLKKQLHVFALLLLLIGQTILGPLTTVSAEGVEPVPPAEQVATEESADTESENEPVVEETPEITEISEVPPVTGGENDEDPESQEPPIVDAPLDGPASDDSGEGEVATGEYPVRDEGDGTEPQAGPFNPVMPESVIKSVDFKINNGPNLDLSQDVKVKNGDKASFVFYYELAPGHDGKNYGEGTTLTYTLPPIFKNINFGDAGTDLANEMGTIAVDGQNVVITFSDKINDYKPIVKGSFFRVEADFSSSNTKWEETISLPGAENIKLNFQPKGGDKITKTGTPDNGGKNSKFINWKVTVNTNDGSSGAQDFVDELEGAHTFVTDPSKVIVKEILITPSGLGTADAVVPVNPIFENGNKKMTIALPDQEHTGYEITYQTEVGDPGNVSSAEFKNTATYDGKPISKEPKVTFGEPLEKKSSGPNVETLETEWTIYYNFNNRNIDKDDAKLTDTWTINSGGSNHPEDTPEIELVGDLAGIQIFEEDGTTPATIGITPTRTASGFELQFNADVTKPYVIKYTTKPVDVYPTESFTVSNEVTRKDMTVYKDNINKASSNYSKNALLLDKSTYNKQGTDNGIDYAKKEMSWKIVANQKGYDLPAKTVFKDTYSKDADGNTYLDLLEDTVVVKDGSTTLVRDTGYKLQKDGKDGFTIILLNGTSNQIEITYDTKYDIEDTGMNTRTYKNTVAILNSDLPEPPSDSAEYSDVIKDEQKANGKKDGYYDYATKTFHWDVELNFNKNDIKNALFEDELPDTQTIDKNNIVVQKGELDSKGNFVAVGDPINGADTATKVNEIQLNLGDITGPYKVTYTSKDTNGVFPHSKGTVTIKNTAKLSGEMNGTPSDNGSWTKEVEVKHTEEIFYKTGSQAGSSALINWSFEFNYAQSKLDNVVITDTVDKDRTDAVQLILPDSFKVYKVALTGQTPANPNTSDKTLVDAKDYTLNVDVKNGTFTLDLGNVDGAYYVTYDTMFIGKKDDPITNEVKVTYESGEGTSGSDNAAVAQFTYGNFADTEAATFVIIKTDAETGEPMEDVEFTLYGPYTGNTPLFKGETDENGILDFGIEFAEGEYTLKETKVQGYKNPDVTFYLDPNGDKVAGKQLVEVENVKEGSTGPACTEFTLTIKDVDGDTVADKDVTLTNTKTGKKHDVKTNGNGEVTLLPADFKVADYKVTTIEGGTEVTLGNVTVKYDGECKADIAPTPSCTEFTVTVNGTDGQPREAGVNITLKGASADIEDNITDEHGKFTVPTTTPAGTYTVYEDKQFLGTVEITYKNDPCAAEVQLAPKCETFILTVRDVDGKTRKVGVEVTIKIKDDITDPGIKKTTNADGEVKLDDLEPNVYEVYENDVLLGEFTTNPGCEASVQPAPNPLTCSVFTITVNDEQSAPRPNVEVNVTVINKDGNQETITATTDVNGNITLPNTTKPGTYKLYEGEVFLGDIEVSYASDCKDEVSQVPTCEEFTLTVNNRNGMPRENVEVTIEDSNGKQIEVDDLNGNSNPVFTTDAKGEIVIASSLIKAGKYTVYENGGKIGDFTVKDECSATVQPAPTTGGGGGGGGGGWNPPAPACKDFTVTAKDQNGKPRANVVLTLKNTAGTVYTLTTNANGEISLPFATTNSGQYTVYEGNTVLGSITVYYSDGDCQAEVTSPIVCTDFTITVKDSEGKVRGNVSVTVKDKDGKVVASGTTNAKGEITVPNTVPSGKYTVYEGEKSLGTVTIDLSKGNCKDEVISPKVCTDFTITVKDFEGKIRANVNVTVKDATGKVVASGTTNAKGEITVPNTVPTGKYTVYEGEKALGTVTIDFAKGNCKDEVTSPKACTDFTLTVKDADGNVRGNMSVTVKDAAGKVVASGTTNAQGEITVPNTVPTGSYTVFEGNTALGTITIDLAAGKCDAVVTIPGEAGESGKPGEPEEPEEPGEPGTPGEPGNPDDGGVLGGQGGQGGAGGSNGPDGGDVLGGQGNQAGSGTDKPKLPQTGDAYPIGSMLAGFGIILAGFWLLVGRRAKKNAM